MKSHDCTTRARVRTSHRAVAVRGAELHSASSPNQGRAVPGAQTPTSRAPRTNETRPCTSMYSASPSDPSEKIVSPASNQARVISLERGRSTSRASSSEKAWIRCSSCTTHRVRSSSRSTPERSCCAWLSCSSTESSSATAVTSLRVSPQRAVGPVGTGRDGAGQGGAGAGRGGAGRDGAGRGGAGARRGGTELDGTGRDGMGSPVCLAAKGRLAEAGAGREGGVRLEGGRLEADRAAQHDVARVAPSALVADAHVTVDADLRAGRPRAWRLHTWRLHTWRLRARRLRPRAPVGAYLHAVVEQPSKVGEGERREPRDTRRRLDDLLRRHLPPLQPRRLSRQLALPRHARLRRQQPCQRPRAQQRGRPAAALANRRPVALTARCGRGAIVRTHAVRRLHPGCTLVTSTFTPSKSPRRMPTARETPHG